MRLSALVITLSITACTDGPEPSSLLPADAHYVALFAPYTSPEDCLANNPQVFACQWSLSFCANGRAARRDGDIVDEGVYYREGPIVHASWESHGPMAFDVETVIEIGGSIPWIVDDARRWETLQFDNISCD